MKKVLFTSHVANFAKFNYPFMRWFKERGYEVHYASMGEEKIDCDKHFTIPFERSPFSLSNLKAVGQLKRIIDSEDYDIIHTHTPMGSVVTRLAALRARKKGTRVIYTAHGFHFFKGASPLAWLVYYPIEKVMSRYTDVLVTINSEDYYRSQKLHAQQTFKVPGVGVDMKRFKPVSETEKKALRKEYGFKNGDFILIYVAELNANKNQSFLIKQLYMIKKDIPNIRLLLCGKGDQMDACRTLINELGLQDVVTLMGYRNDVNRLFVMSDVCVASSVREGLGINLVEAMASGLPVIASRNRGHSEVINKEVWGSLFEQGDSIGFRKAVLDTYDKSKDYVRLANRNREQANQYSLEMALNDMTSIYQRIIKE